MRKREERQNKNPLNKRNRITGYTVKILKKKAEIRTNVCTKEDYNKKNMS